LKLKKITLLICFLSSVIAGITQKINAGFKYHIHKTTEAIKVDGIMHENVWNTADVAESFMMVQPMDTSKAKVPTQVRMTYDDNNIYLIATCYKAGAGVDMVESLKRDWNFTKNDNFIAFIDTYGDLTNGFAFGANSAGAQWDGTMFEGGSVDLNWDNKWTSEITNDNTKYTWEAAIPFKSIRYKAGIMEWGINFSRNDLITTEKSSWAPIPRYFPTASLAYTGTLVWDAPLPEHQNNFSLIPYVKSSVAKEFANNAGVKTNLPTNYNTDFGMDAKISLNSSLNLDLTIHPDFSQVEVDRQVTNLSRFELFFPEKRQFFLENADLFSNLGFENVRPFFSRRIGLTTPIDFGARMSGRLDKNWRIGLMDMKTSADNATSTMAQNFSVLAIQRKLFKKSSVEFFYIDKTALDYSPTKQGNAFNRNFGFEFLLAPKNNTWSGKTIFIKSITPDKHGNDMMNAANLQYSTKKWIVSWQHELVGNNYNAEVGYVPRNNYVKISPSITRLFFPNSGAVLSHGPQFNSTFYFNTSLSQTDNTKLFTYLVTFRNKTTIAAIAQNDYVELLSPFDPTRIGKTPLSAHTIHQWSSTGFDLISAPQHKFTYALSSRVGGYYANGSLFSVTANVGYRIQPFVNIDLSSTFNHIGLPQPWGNNNFLLVGPKVDVTMTNKLFFTTFFQYNEQTKNINFNTRFQWRYKPASDLFIVYTDNYYIGPVFVKNRAVVLKFTYWWNK
jgi:hypothetical protein